MKLGRLFLVLTLLLLGIIIYMNKCREGKPNSAPSPQGGKPGSGPVQPLVVSGVVVSPSVVKDVIYASGTLLSNNEVELRNEMAGRLVHILFEEGRTVKKGDLLIKLYDEDLQAQLRKLEVDKAQAAKNLSRTKDLLDIKGVSQQDYEEALNVLNKITADLDLTRAQLSKTEIHAPFTGIIGLRTVSEGAFLAPNTRIATIQQIDPIKLEFSIPERYRESIQLGETVVFHVESASTEFLGKVYAYEPKIDLQTRSLTLRALCSNPGNVLLPGSFAKVNVPLKKIEQALMIPSQCVIPELKGQKVYIVHEARATPVKITIGLRNDSTVQVLTGLQIGDTVLSTGIMQMRPDMPVRVNVN